MRGKGWCHEKRSMTPIMCKHPEFFKFKTTASGGDGFHGREEMISWTNFLEDFEGYLDLFIQNTTYSKAEVTLSKRTVKRLIEERHWILVLEVHYGENDYHFEYFNARITWGIIAANVQKDDGIIFLRQKIYEIAEKFFRCATSMSVGLLLSNESKQELKIKVEND